MKNSLCQSCGMPLNKDSKGCGADAEGSKNQYYCCHCYQNGQFTLPELTASEMQQKVKKKMKTMKIPGFITWFFVRKIPTLTRWR